MLVFKFMMTWSTAGGFCARHRRRRRLRFSGVWTNLNAVIQLLTNASRKVMNEMKMMSLKENVALFHAGKFTSMHTWEFLQSGGCQTWLLMEYFRRSEHFSSRNVDTSTKTRMDQALRYEDCMPCSLAAFSSASWRVMVLYAFTTPVS